MSDAPDAAAANSAPEILSLGPVEGVSGVGVAAEAPAGILEAPGAWVANAFPDNAEATMRYLAVPTEHRAGMACVVGTASATETRTAEELTAQGMVGIYRVVSACAK